MGPLAFLPIHAAGLFDSQEVGDKVSDYVVSSYTPTLTAIIDQSQPIRQDTFRILAISSQGNNNPPIPQVEYEVELIRKIAGDLKVDELTRENATVNRVLEEMRGSSWCHFACHGQQNTSNPMKSGFHLHDRVLELSEIVKAYVPNAEFAFLSACQTATGDDKLAEESVHLAAAMLIAGYRGVIATMWSISDTDAPQIVHDVYCHILRGGKPDREGAAHALHEAVKRLRESGASFASWVPFIHVGR